MNPERITGTENTISLQQIQDRIEHLMTLLNIEKEPDDADYAWPKKTGDAYDPDDIDEFRELIRFKTGEVPTFDGNLDDVLFVNDEYFEQYAGEVSHDRYRFNDDDWPFRHIDWEKAVEDLLQVYKHVELFDSMFYYSDL